TIAYGYDLVAKMRLVYVAGTFVYSGNNTTGSISSPGLFDATCPNPAPDNAPGGAGAISRVWFETLEYDPVAVANGTPLTLTVRNFGITPNCNYNVYLPTLTANPLTGEVSLVFYSDHACPLGVLDSDCGLASGADTAGLYTLACDGDVFTCTSLSGGGTAPNLATTLFDNCQQIYTPTTASHFFPIDAYAVPNSVPAATAFFEPNGFTDYIGAFTELNGTFLASYVGGNEPIMQAGTPPTATYSSEGCMTALAAFDPPAPSTGGGCRQQAQSGRQACRDEYCRCLADAGTEFLDSSRCDSWGRFDGFAADEDFCAPESRPAGSSGQCWPSSACCSDNPRRESLHWRGGGSPGGGCSYKDAGPSPSDTCRAAECDCLATVSAVEQACDHVQAAVDGMVAGLGPLPSRIMPVETTSFAPLTSSASAGQFGAACAKDSDCAPLSGQTCLGSRCTCSPDMLPCGIDGGGVLCANLLADPQNCGLCGAVCSSGICSNATCAP
ncbi:MAG TPA: hypothetical protein VMB50_06135, partial [Myxococcales bacterium]|nr:hypothetical protein [Myxococcales bacterium]